MSWLKRDIPATPTVPPDDRLERMAQAVAELGRAVASLDVQLKLQARNLDDLDESLRRFKGRRAKHDERHPEQLEEPLNGSKQLPSIAQLRSANRLPWR